MLTPRSSRTLVDGETTMYKYFELYKGLEKISFVWSDESDQNYRKGSKFPGVALVENDVSEWANKTGRLEEAIKNIAVAQKVIDESKKKHPEWQAPKLRLVHP